MHSLSYVYQRSTTAISVGKLLVFLHLSKPLLLVHDPDIINLRFLSVSPICYAHLAAAQVAQFIKFDEMSETSSSQGGGTHTSAGSVPVQELPRLHEKVKSSMFFC